MCDEYLDFVSQNKTLSLSLSLSMADQYILCLIGAMDHLWFNRIVLFSKPTVLVAKTLEPPQPTSSESHAVHLSSLYLSPASDEQFSSPPPEEQEAKSSPSDSSPLTPQENLNIEEEINLKERPTRLNLISARARSLSFSPSTQKRGPRRLRQSTSMLTLQKSMSCRSLWELELEEVKGFMDLGFIFKKENINPTMMKIVPGLQRVGLYKNKQNPEPDLEACHESTKDDENKQEEYEKGIMRPYLSEAWLIKRPDSPLLNLRMPRISASADMKKHLRFWAKTVASTVHQER